MKGLEIPAPSPDPCCIACGTAEALELVSMRSSGGFHLEIHLCRSHVGVYLFQSARMLVDLMNGKLSIP